MPRGTLALVKHLSHEQNVLQYRSAESLRELLASALMIVCHNMHLGQVKVQLMHFMA